MENIHLPASAALRGAHRSRTSRTERVLRLRVLRARDAPAVRRFLERIHPRDMRLRFHRTVHVITDAVVADLTRHDRDTRLALAVVAMRPGRDDEVLAILNAARDGERAEWALLVRSDLQGRGLGTLLLDALLRWARRIRVRELHADTFPDNHRLLALARRFGHTVRTRSAENVELTRSLAAEPAAHG